MAPGGSSNPPSSGKPPVPPKPTKASAFTKPAETAKTNPPQSKTEPIPKPIELPIIIRPTIIDFGPKVTPKTTKAPPPAAPILTEPKMEPTQVNNPFPMRSGDPFFIIMQDRENKRSGQVVMVGNKGNIFATLGIGAQSINWPGAVAADYNLIAEKGPVFTIGKYVEQLGGVEAVKKNKDFYTKGQLREFDAETILAALYICTVYTTEGRNTQDIKDVFGNVTPDKVEEVKQLAKSILIHTKTTDVQFSWLYYDISSAVHDKFLYPKAFRDYEDAQNKGAWIKQQVDKLKPLVMMTVLDKYGEIKCPEETTTEQVEEAEREYRQEMIYFAQAIELLYVNWRALGVMASATFPRDLSLVFTAAFEGRVDWISERIMSMALEMYERNNPKDYTVYGAVITQHQRGAY